ncbi:hypothetical protein ACP70R_003831 [Stipagrostis hirtigluma subsp. patula]
MSQSKMASASEASCADDLIGALPDGVLRRILGFLQADEAVRTSLLARRWRHLWRSMPVLRLTAGAARSVRFPRRFLDHLFLLRDRSNLEACMFDFDILSEHDLTYVNLWIRHALLCQVQELSVFVWDSVHKRYDLPLADLPVVSQHLTRLKLTCVKLYDKFLDFSSCPALKDLRIESCHIAATRISSRSIEYLNIEHCSCVPDTRVRISAPNLISLRLHRFEDRSRTPLLEDMPLLVTAVVELDSEFRDRCDGLDPGYCDDEFCDGCYGTDDGSAGCVLLKSLSAATDLTLTADPEVFILKRDLRWCPTFSKLKTLLLNEWCVATDDRALICILQHAPVLEKLTFDLSMALKEKKARNMVPSKAIYNSTEQSFASENLKRIEVTCREVDEWVDKILKYLVSYGIPLEKIAIKQENTISEYVSLSLVQVSSQSRAEKFCAFDGLITTS